MKVVFDENVFDENDHFHPNFDESAPNPARQLEMECYDKMHVMLERTGQA